VFPNAPLKFKVSALSIRALAEQLAESGGMLVVHGEDDEVVMEGYQRALNSGDGNLKDMANVHSTLSERLAFARVIELLDDIEGARIYFMHVSAKDGLDAIARAQARGRAVYGETLQQFLLADDRCYAQPEGIVFHTYPSVKSEADSAGLWAGIMSGALSVIATDALCTPRSVKLAGQRIDNAVGGGVGVEPRMALMYTEMVVNRGASEAAYVDAVSTNAARLMGMYPQKGTIAIGADADLALLDTSTPVTLTAEFLHESDYTPWEGRQVFGWPRVTIVNGTLAMKDGALLAREGDGRLVRRRLSADAMSTVTRSTRANDASVAS
jgi:dihydropyrimidinase